MGPSNGIVERRFALVDFDPTTASVAVLGMVVPSVNADPASQQRPA
jgi:hypothetical protein